MKDQKFDIVSKWRKSRLHRKCLYCKFSSHLPSTPCSAGTWLCKDKEVSRDIPRPVCSCFRINKEQCEEIDKMYNSH